MGSMKEIIEEWKMKKDALKNQYYHILSTCKKDMKEEFAASPKIRLEIEQFSANQMDNIVKEVDALQRASYWVALREAVEKELCKR